MVKAELLAPFRAAVLRSLYVQATGGSCLSVLFVLYLLIATDATGPWSISDSQRIELDADIENVAFFCDCQHCFNKFRMSSLTDLPIVSLVVL